MPRFDCAVFADTRNEPGAEERRLGLPDPPESVYAHLDWLVSLHGPPILVRTRGCISDDLTRGENSTGQRFATIPAFTATVEGGKHGMLRRQCTKEYKIEVIEQTIRREVVGLKPGQHVPRGVTVHQSIGISWEERTRAVDIARRFLTESGRARPNWLVHFPLLEMNGETGWSRDDCEAYNQIHVPHQVYGSACIFCPFQDDATWAKRMEPGPTREKLLQIDTAIRTPGIVVNRGLDQKLYLHADCRPLDQIDFKRKDQLAFAMECEGGCGL